MKRELSLILLVIICFCACIFSACATTGPGSTGQTSISIPTTPVKLSRGEMLITGENVSQLIGVWRGVWSGERYVIKPEGRYPTEFIVVATSPTEPFKAIVKYYGGGRFNNVEFPVEVRIKNGMLELIGGPVQADLALNVSGSGVKTLGGNFVFRDGPGSLGRYLFFKKD